MIEFIQQYWLEAIFTGLLGLITRKWSQMRRDQEQREKAIDDELKSQGIAILALLHNQIFSLGRRYLGRGWITIQELDNLEGLYTAYHDKGGNGTGTEIYRRCRSLPIKPDTGPEMKEMEE